MIGAARSRPAAGAPGIGSTWMERTTFAEGISYTSQTAIAGASRRAFSVAVGRSASGV